MTDPIITVDGVSKTFLLTHNASNSLKKKFIAGFRKDMRGKTEEFQALDDVSFALYPGSSMALLGNNGSGKSTLLQILARILKPSSGTVTTRGLVAPLIELGVGFHPELTGEENIYLNASMFGLGNKETRLIFNEIVDFSGLGNFIDTPVKNYSSGMYMRLGFSVAAHIEPDILLVDEVLAVGDADFQQKCHARIRNLQQAGMTLILVTHDDAMARRFCNQYLRLDHGRVLESGEFN
jgi:ABC-2 type transport system ATP-binding protein/lipopolysaccharide transport system ATP-binding protein